MRAGLKLQLQKIRKGLRTKWLSSPALRRMEGSRVVWWWKLKDDKVDVNCKYEAKTGICNRLDIPLAAATALWSSSIYSTLYFCWINSYWLQVHTALHILGRKTGTCGSGFRYTLSFIILFDKLISIGHRYTPYFIFWMRKQMTAWWVHSSLGKYHTI